MYHTPVPDKPILGGENGHMIMMKFTHFYLAKSVSNNMYIRGSYKQAQEVGISYNSW